MSKTLLLISPPLPITRKALGWLIFCLILTVSWHFSHIPLWAIGACFFVGFWRYFLEIKGQPLPSRGLRFLLTFLAFGAIILTYQSFLGRDPGITALVLFSALKLLEMKSFRDFMVVIFLCFFLLMGLFLFDQSLYSFLVMAPTLIFLVSIILMVNHPDSSRLNLKNQKLKKEFKNIGFIKSSLKLLVFSLPLLLILFIFFPRTSGPLWNLPQGSTGRARSGFGDFIRPGYIAWVAQSFETAFRVSFPDNNMPANSELYFRGLVLWNTDGKFWFQGIFPFRQRSSPPLPDNAIRQDIVLEPHNRKWLFALDRPVSFPDWSGQLPGYIFQTRRPLKRHLRYRVYSQLSLPREVSLHPVIKKWALQLPRRLNPNVRQLALSFRMDADTDEQVASAILNFFKNSDFKYTLNPGWLNRDDPIADFLFNHKKGFCEHFASSFALLARIAGIPTRVVIGYQGGKYNPLGKYLLVRQAEAHAWTEVWLENRGWVRIDPTAVISPERIEYGVDLTRSISALSSISDSERSAAIRRVLKKGLLQKIWDALENFWDNLSTNWNYWVVSFDQDQQKSTLDDLGLVEVNWMVQILIVFLAAVVVYSVGSFIFKLRSSPTSPLLKLYNRFCGMAERAGIKRHPWEGPVDFRERIKKRYPQKSKIIDQITSLYINMQYGKLSPTKPHLKKLKILILQLHF
jgi:transglutaminase-like putative cysteine protease